MLPRNATNVALVWRGTVCASTSPERVFDAANKDSVRVAVILKPVVFRTSRRQRQDRNHPIQRVIWVFSSTPNTTAPARCPGARHVIVIDLQQPRQLPRTPVLVRSMCSEPCQAPVYISVSKALQGAGAAAG